MASSRTALQPVWLRMLSLSLLLTSTSLASDLAPVGTFATQGQATAVVPASKQTNAIDSVLAAIGKTDIPTSILSTVVVTVKATPTPPLIPDSKPVLESPAIAAPALSPTQTHLVAAQASDAPQLNGSPFDTDDSSPSEEPDAPDSTPHPFPLPGGGHGPVVPSSNTALIFSLAGSSPTSPINANPSPVQTIFITTAGNGAASTVTSFINTAANASPGLAGDRDSSAMTTSMPKSTTYLTVSGGAGQSRSFTTITAAGAGASTSVSANATAKPSLVKNSGSSVGGDRSWSIMAGSSLVTVLLSVLLL